MTPDPDEILKSAKAMHAQQIKWRRHFHQNPEISNNEFETTAFINKILKKEKIRILPLKNMKTGTAALISGKMKNAKTVAIRTDIDALPIIEQNDIPFKSKTYGVMHACGHDVHMAVVLGSAILLNRMKDKLNGNVKFLFQPAEESPPGGASAMIKAGIMKNPRVNMVFGLHVDPSLPVGKFSLRDGPTMASVTDFDISVKGRTGHAAVPHRAVDAIAVAAELVDSMQKIISREIDPMGTAVITFGTIEGGTARNVIADRVRLRATARTLSPSTLKRLPRLIKRTVNGICRARGARADLEFIASYPVLDNHRSANRVLMESMNELFGSSNVTETPTVMGGEDFAFYLREAPGAMFRLGIKNRRIGADKSWHSPEFMVDEEAIYYGTAALVDAAIRYLGRNKI